MAILLFIAKLIVSSGLLYGYYHFFLRNQRFHHYNRFYLLLAVLVSLLIPFLHIPVQLFWAQQQHSTLVQTLKVINGSGWETPVVIYGHQGLWAKWLNLQAGFYLLYAAGLITAGFVMLKSLLYISRLRRKYPYETIERLKIYQTCEPGTPFSFFRSIFWDEKMTFNHLQGQQIFRHEMFHVKEQHSADILFMELACCIVWFNPFFHLIKKEIKAIHEFLADEYAVSSSNRYDYAELLVLHAIKQKTPALTHPFFHNQIKRRITMITQSNLVRRSGYISRIMALPLLFLLVSAFAVKLTGNPAPEKRSSYSNKTLTVVIDPGHGGIYDGSQNGELKEKDINLAIAQQLKALSAQYNLNIVLTRNSDALVGNAADLKEDLMNRVSITEAAKADLFISIHVNAAMDAKQNILKTVNKSGFEAYISNRRTDAASRQLASALLLGLKNIYEVAENIQQRETGIAVLDKNTCPAVILECGYINNPKDLAFISNPANQQSIARKILEGIVQYSNAQSEGGLIQNDTIAKVNYTKEDKTSADTLVKVTYFSHSKTNSDTVPGKIFTKVEFEADYPGGPAGWIKYLTEHLKYPDEAVKKNIQGTVVMQFIVNTDGTISDVKAISGPEILKAQSIKAIKESGVWVPAQQNGKKVRAYKRQPITYKMA